MFRSLKRVVGADPDLFAGVWLDPETSRFAVGVADWDRAEEARSALRAYASEVTIVESAYSTSALNSIVDSVYQQPGLDSINGAFHDWPNDRVVLTTEVITERLLDTLEDTYGSAVAVMQSDPMG